MPSTISISIDEPVKFLLALADNGGKILFSENVLGVIYDSVELYRKILYNPTGGEKNLASFIWNVEADSKQLIDKLYAKFVEMMKTPKKYHDFLTNDEYNSEHIYTSIVDRPGGRFYGIKTDYINSYENFVCREALNIITAELEGHIDKLKGMIG